MRDARLAWAGLALAIAVVAVVAVVAGGGHHRHRPPPRVPTLHLPRNLPPAGAMF